MYKASIVPSIIDHLAVMGTWWNRKLTVRLQQTYHWATGAHSLFSGCSMCSDCCWWISNMNWRVGAYGRVDGLLDLRSKNLGFNPQSDVCRRQTSCSVSISVHPAVMGTWWNKTHWIVIAVSGWKLLISPKRRWDCTRVSSNSRGVNCAVHRTGGISDYKHIQIVLYLKLSFSPQYLINYNNVLKSYPLMS